MRLLFQLPADRRKPGKVYVTTEVGHIIRGPWRCLGKSDDAQATKKGNPQRNPLKNGGDTPLGLYRVRSVETRADESKYGWKPVFCLEAVQGDALVAKENGRPGPLICGGDNGQNGGLRPANGNLRVDNDTMITIHAMIDSRGEKISYVLLERLS